MARTGRPPIDPMDRVSEMTTINFKPREKIDLMNLSDARGMSLSDFVRVAVGQYVAMEKLECGSTFQPTYFGRPADREKDALHEK